MKVWGGFLHLHHFHFPLFSQVKYGIFWLNDYWISFSAESLDKSLAYLLWSGQHLCSRLTMLLRVDYAETCKTFLVRLSQQLLDMLAVNTDHFMLGGGHNLWFHVYISHSDLLFCSVCFVFFVLSSSSTPPAWEPNTSPPTNLVQMLAVCIKMKKQKQKNKTHMCSQTKQCANCCAPVLSS